MKGQSADKNRPFPSSAPPPFQSEAKCEVFVMKISFIHIEIGSNYHNKNFALRLALKERLRRTRKWPIVFMKHKFAHGVTLFFLGVCYLHKH